MNANLIVDENYIREQTAEICAALKSLDSTLKKYIRCISLANSVTIKEGETADALATFIEYASVLKYELGKIADTTRLLMNNYLMSIDAADSYLY